MLVLTRKKGERVMIGDDIVVTVIDVRGDGVRIGFDAPRGVKIQRAEVVRAVTEANTEAAANTAVTADLMAGLLAARTKPAVDRPAPQPEQSGAQPAPAEQPPVVRASTPSSPPKPAPRRRPS